MKRFTLFCFAMGLSMLLTSIAVAEGVRIGATSGADMLPKSFSPSYDYQSTPNAPAKSVNFTVNTADQQSQAAGDTCSTDGPMGTTSAASLAFDPGPVPTETLPDFVSSATAGSGPGEGWTYDSNAGQWVDPKRQPNWDRSPSENPGEEDPAKVTPEPSTMLILGIGLAAGVVPFSRRLRREK